MKFLLIQATLYASVTILAAASVPMSSHERVMFCAGIGFVGGSVSASRTGRTVRYVVQTGVETAVMGSCLSLFADSWVRESQPYSLAVIGAAGILGMMGRSGVDWVLGFFRKIVNKKAGDYVSDGNEDK